MNKKKDNSNLMMTLLKGRTLFVLIILFIFFSIKADSFCTVNSLLLVCKHVAQYGILGIGMTYVIITGGIDLSVGSVVGLVGMIAGGLIQEGLTLKFAGVTLYFSVPAITVICIIIGIIIGIVNGALIAKCKLAPFIVTLGTMYIGRGLANIRSGGNTFSSIKGQEALGNVGIMKFDSRVFAVGGFPGIPIAAILFLILAVIAAFVLKKTPFGWHILAIGGNEKAARLSGIKVEKNIILVYAISGACSALIGLVTMAQIAASHPNTGDTWEMNAIAAVVLGGTSMAGGVGTIGGTVIGAFVIGIINDGMTMCGVSEFWQKVIKGLVIILAVLIDQFQRNLQAKMALQARNENK